MTTTQQLNFAEKPAGVPSAQRWIIEACDYPKPGWHVVGFAGDHKGAVQLADAIAAQPGCSATRIRDRKVLS